MSVLCLCDCKAVLVAEGDLGKGNKADRLPLLCLRATSLVCIKSL